MSKSTETKLAWIAVIAAVVWAFYSYKTGHMPKY
jgi:hypothetical protein